MAQHDDPAVKIVPYDRASPKIFGRLREHLAKVIPHKVQIEHAGSTAIVGLGGKGIIDILIVTEKEFMDKTMEMLEADGYRPYPEPISEERLFASGTFKYQGREVKVHIHMTFSGSSEHKNKLLFRDYLRAHPDEAKNYYDLKKQWSIKAGPDRPKYSELKTSFINRMLKKAREELDGS